MADLLASLLGWLLAAGLAASILVFAFLLGRRVAPQAPLSIRWSAMAVIGLFSMLVVFYSLASLGLFRLWVALPVWLCLAMGARRWCDPQRQAWREFQTELGSLRRSFGGLSPLIKSAAVVFTAFLLLRVGRALVAPVLGWDALMFHLVHPANWIQQAGFHLEFAPDAWGYHTHFPQGGSVIWAWAMLPVRGAGLVKLASVAMIPLILLGAYSAIRQLDVPRGRAALVAMAVASTPGVLMYASGAYVDNINLAALLLGVAFLLRLGRTGRPGDALLCGMALGVAATIKMAGLAQGVVGMSLLAGVLVLRRGTIRARLGSLAAAAVPACLPLVHHLRTWALTGNPLYPVEVQLFGRVLFEGNPQFTALKSGAAFPPEMIGMPAGEWLAKLFVIPGLPGFPHLNLGPAAPFIALLGLVGLALARRHRAAVAWVVGMLMVGAWMLAAEQFTTMWTVWLPINGRHLVPCLAALALVAASVGGWKWDRMWLALIGVNLLLGLHSGLQGPEALAVAAVLATGALGWIGVWLARRLVRGPVGRPVAVGIALLALALVSTYLRDTFRWPITASATTRPQAFDPSPLSPGYASAWPIWRWLDAQPAARVALVAGWDGYGHNTYRYPLFGRDLRHRVLHVPPSRSGRLIDARDADVLTAQAHYPTWLRALEAADIDLVVSLAPETTPESGWLTAYPDLFDLVASSTDGRSHAYRIDRAAVSRALDTD